MGMRMTAGEGFAISALLTDAQEQYIQRVMNGVLLACENVQRREACFFNMMEPGN